MTSADWRSACVVFEYEPRQLTLVNDQFISILEVSSKTTVPDGIRYLWASENNGTRNSNGVLLVFVNASLTVSSTLGRYLEILLISGVCLRHLCAQLARRLHPVSAISHHGAFDCRARGAHRVAHGVNDAHQTLMHTTDFSERHAGVADQGAVRTSSNGCRAGCFDCRGP